MGVRVKPGKKKIKKNKKCSKSAPKKGALQNIYIASLFLVLVMFIGCCFLPFFCKNGHQTVWPDIYSGQIKYITYCIYNKYNYRPLANGKLRHLDTQKKEAAKEFEGSIEYIPYKYTYVPGTVQCRLGEWGFSWMGVLGYIRAARADGGGGRVT